MIVNMKMKMWLSRQLRTLITDRLSRANVTEVKLVGIASTINLSEGLLIHGIRQVDLLQGQSFKLMSNLYNTNGSGNDLEIVQFEKVCSETLESLTAYFEELVETKQKLANAEVSFSNGVLNINLGKHGTYVINRQSPNKQIWLSSPVSGPKRYDYILERDSWVYKRDSKTLHQLLQSEISALLCENIDMSDCAYSKC